MKSLAAYPKHESMLLSSENSLYRYKNKRSNECFLFWVLSFTERRKQRGGN
jgi:hypothetical protein